MLCLAALVCGQATASEYDALHDHTAGRFTVSAGIEYDDGDYGSDLGATEDWYLPYSLAYAQSSWRLKLTVPWLETTSPAPSLTAGPETRLGATDSQPCAPRACTTRTTEAGIGDVSLAAYYLLPLPSDWPEFELGARAKAPTADVGRGLGTGAWDYSLMLDVYAPFGPAALVAGLRRTFKGDLEAGAIDLPLDDVFAAYVGAEYRVVPSVLGGIAFDWREGSTRFAPDALELSAYTVWKPVTTLSVTLTLGGGFNDASPDVFAGVSAAWRFAAPWL